MTVNIHEPGLWFKTRFVTCGTSGEVLIKLKDGTDVIVLVLDHEPYFRAKLHTLPEAAQTWAIENAELGMSFSHRGGPSQSSTLELTNWKIWPGWSLPSLRVEDLLTLKGRSGQSFEVGLIVDIAQVVR